MYRWKIQKETNAITNCFFYPTKYLANVFPVLSSKVRIFFFYKSTTVLVHLPKLYIFQAAFRLASYRRIVIAIASDTPCFQFVSCICTLYLIFHLVRIFSFMLPVDGYKDRIGVTRPPDCISRIIFFGEMPSASRSYYICLSPWYAGMIWRPVHTWPVLMRYGDTT